MHRTSLLRLEVSQDHLKRGDETVDIISFTRAGLLVIGLWLVMLSPMSFGGQGLPKNVQMTNEAWDAFNKKNYERAIAKANECISEFLGQANRKEKSLEQQNSDPPATGKVSDKVKEKIFAFGPLNDVATCYFIIGRSYEFLGKVKEAREAYTAAKRYEYARTWDPQGQLFWSPSEAASDRLDMLNK
jgi:hypothetical protein